LFFLRNRLASLILFKFSFKTKKEIILKNQKKEKLKKNKKRSGYFFRSLF
jgi:hypothetical protein